jgi:hypothetical protein
MVTAPVAASMAGTVAVSMVALFSFCPLAERPRGREREV